MGSKSLNVEEFYPIIFDVDILRTSFSLGKMIVVEMKMDEL